MSAWFIVAWLTGMVALAFCAAASVGPGTNPRERTDQDRQRRQDPRNPKHRETIGIERGHQK